MNQRTPRPLGLTQKIVQLKTKEKKDKQGIIEEYYIREYIQNNFMFNGIRYSLEEFSRYTSIAIQKIEKEMVMEVSRIGISMEENELGNTLRAITQSLFIGALGNKAIALKQYSTLAGEQAGRYVPFLSSSVNQSITNLFQADHQTLQILKALLPSNGIIALEGKSNKANSGNSLNHEKAIELLKEVGPKPITQNIEGIKLLEAKYELGTMPEVIANRQSGYDNSNEGLDFDNLANIQLEAMPKEDFHNDRRAHELDIDLEQDEI